MKYGITITVGASGDDNDGYSLFDYAERGELSAIVSHAIAALDTFAADTITAADPANPFTSTEHITLAESCGFVFEGGRRCDCSDHAATEAEARESMYPTPEPDQCPVYHIPTRRQCEHSTAPHDVHRFGTPGRDGASGMVTWVEHNANDMTGAFPVTGETAEGE